MDELSGNFVLDGVRVNRGMSQEIVASFYKKDRSEFTNEDLNEIRKLILTADKVKRYLDIRKELELP